MRIEAAKRINISASAHIPKIQVFAEVNAGVWLASHSGNHIFFETSALDRSNRYQGTTDSSGMLQGTGNAVGTTKQLDSCFCNVNLPPAALHSYFRSIDNPEDCLSH
jgi:hypothetical protein